MNHIDVALTDYDWADIPAGEFMMGSPNSEKGHCDNECQHLIQVNSFKILKAPITFTMFDTFCDATDRVKPGDQGWGRATRPVINVSYWDAVDYCDWLSMETDWTVRLPTEAEWEYACRAGTATPFWSGESIHVDQAHYMLSDDPSKNIMMTLPVKYHQANAWGLCDMHGNVWEWCASEYDEGYSGKELEDVSKDRANENVRVLRGGSWFCRLAEVRAAKRVGSNPLSTDSFSGFRIAISL